ncbi:MAG: DNA translocase FtsK 4TM domain-containing protein [Planctomycetota bacterium]
MPATGKLTAARRRDLGAEILALLLLALTAFFFLSVYSEQLMVQGAVGRNACGAAGHLLSGLAFRWFGLVASYLLSGVLAVWALSSFFRVRITAWRWKLAGAAIFLLSLSVLEFRYTLEPLLGGAYPYRGGVFGEWFGGRLILVFDRLGTDIVTYLLLLVGLLLATDVLFSPLVRIFFWRGGAAVVGAGRRVPGMLGRLRAEEAGAASGRGRKKPGVAGRPSRKGRRRGGAVTAGVAAGDPDEPAEATADGVSLAEVGSLEEGVAAEGLGAAQAQGTKGPATAGKGAPGSTGRRKRPPREIRLSSEPAAKATGETIRFDEQQLSLTGVYSLPPLSFLENPLRVDHDEGREELEEVAEKIEKTLASFKIEAQVDHIQRGPVITQYEVSLAAGIKVHKIVSLADDLAMALSAQSVRVVAPIPGKSAVGIEVPNRKRERVCLKEVLRSRAYQESETQIPLLLGKDAAGDPIVEDLSSMPHLLIAGSTGSGKSVCINGIIASLLMTRTPEELKLILVDPKMVELSSFEEIPHLLTPVITDMKKAPAALDWLVRKMDERYELLSAAEVRHIRAYNSLGKERIFERLSKKMSHEEADAAPEHLPFIVIIIDELADLMMTASKEVEGSIIRLSQKSRAVGIHVILATQRPSVDVITGLIKSNLPCRISFMVASRIDSRTILDRNGAEKLLGQGDMLYLPTGTSALVRAQATFISDKEIRRIVRFLKKEMSPDFSGEIEDYLTSPGGREEEEEGPSPIDDELFEDAVRVVLETQRGSTTLLQRRLGIGYTRASRLMDVMSERGIVGPFKGSKAREILVSPEEWETMRSGDNGAGG